MNFEYMHVVEVVIDAWLTIIISWYRSILISFHTWYIGIFNVAWCCNQMTCARSFNAWCNGMTRSSYGAYYNNKYYSNNNIDIYHIQQ